jgi:broad specificity phosphatase PhoE
MSIFIVRHGNTFTEGAEPRRIGIKTDLPLVESGKVQSHLLGKYFKTQNIRFDQVFCSSLKRTKETAAIITSYTSPNQTVFENHLFDEIDHGVDEGKIESEVINRIGKETIEKWDKYGVEPDGWNVNYEFRIKGWKRFLDDHNHQ